MDHFIVGGNETCLMADVDGNLKIVGEAGKRKHENNVLDYRGSCTMYRSGCPAGHNDPTAFVMSGTKHPSWSNEKYLVKEGCAPGSYMVMMERAFMADQAWKKSLQT